MVALRVRREESPSSIGQRTPLTAGPPPTDLAERIRATETSSPAFGGVRGNAAISTWCKTKHLASRVARLSLREERGGEKVGRRSLVARWGPDG